MSSRFVDKPKRYTAWYDANSNGAVDMPGDYSAIDHILLSPELAGRIEKVHITQDHNPMEVPDHFLIVVRYIIKGDEICL
jgi:exonuclease III